MEARYVSRADIGRMLGLKADAVAALCRAPGFPAPVVLNARVYRYPAREVEAYLSRLRLGRVEPEARASVARPASAPPVKVSWSVDVSRAAPTRLTSV